MPQDPVIANELDLLSELVPLAGARLVELGCGAARLARELLERHPDAELVGLEVDERQLAKNLAAPQERLQFVGAGAEAIPFPDAHFDGALMLKSLHHVPMERMADALAEIRRVLRPDGWLYVSEPVYGGPFNEVVKIFNDEGVVRAAAQRALDGVSLSVEEGEVMLLMGPSGSGKTTLVSIMGCILRASSGSVEIRGEKVSGLSEKQLPRVRLEHIGFIFQGFNLFPTLTAGENVELALDLKGIRGAEARRRSSTLPPSSLRSSAMRRKA